MTIARLQLFITRAITSTNNTSIISNLFTQHKQNNDNQNIRNKKTARRTLLYAKVECLPSYIFGFFLIRKKMKNFVKERKIKKQI